MKKYLKLIRFEQWYKNILVFLPLIFANEITHEWPMLILGFFGFSSVSAITYIINDWLDREKDRMHPTKKYRPLASGAIKGKQAIRIAILLAIIAGVAGWQLGVFYTGIIATYFIITNLYSLGLKNIPLIDITIISGNFALRTLAGMTKWPTPSVLPYLGLLIGFIIIFITYKRSSDIKLMGEKAAEHKPVLRFYGKKMLYAIRTLAYVLLSTAFYQLLIEGLEWWKVAIILAWLIATTGFFSKYPKLAMKPHSLLKNWKWDLITLTMIFVLLI
ncbi:MAG: UbiA family prenyltransferase [Candidatus Peregrinibacteria bacterium]|nr:UbiA family prenyltransferase [Candidatus Peregrinibacteria bacterium]